MPTPVKYYNPKIKQSYKEIEAAANQRLLGLLPEPMAKTYQKSFFEEDPQVISLVKAADKLSALIKCIEELRMGNDDFRQAKNAQLESLHAMNLPEVEQFMEEFLPAYELTLDEMQNIT